MKIKILFTILQLYIVTLVNCADVKDEESEFEETDSYDQVDSKFIPITGLTLSSIDLVACLYVLVRTLSRWRQNKEFPMPMCLLFPFYIAFIEFGISISQIIDWSYPAIVSKTWPEPLCSMIGFSSMFLLNFGMNLVTFIIFITWYKVMKNTKFYFGRYDYVIFLITFGITICYTLIGVGEFGEVHTRCSIQSHNSTIVYLSLAITTTNLLSLLIFYAKAVIHIKRSDLDLDRREKEISKKTLSYTPTYISRLILLMVYSVSTLYKRQYTIMDLIYILGMVICGLLITIQYIINEGWIDKPIPLSNLSREKPRTVSSIRFTGTQFPFIKIQIDVVQQQTTQPIEADREPIHSPIRNDDIQWLSQM